MMRSTITRTLAVSEITAFKLTMEDGTPKVENLPVIVVAGKASERDAMKVIRKQYGKDSNITVGKIETHEDLYEISVEDFMKYATKVEPEAAE